MHVNLKVIHHFIVSFLKILEFLRVNYGFHGKLALEVPPLESDVEQGENLENIGFNWVVHVQVGYAASDEF